MSRSIRGDNCLTDVRRAKKLSGRVAHDQKLTRSNKGHRTDMRSSMLLNLSDSYQHAINKTDASCYTH